MKRLLFFLVKCSWSFILLISCVQTFDSLDVITGVSDALGLNDLKLSSMLPDWHMPCEFQCPKSKRAVARKNYQPSHNGCGTYNFQMDFDSLSLYGFNECCNVHDVCYGTCNMLKDDCDLEFRQCLLKRCKEVRSRREGATNNKARKQTCEETADFMYRLTVQLGCPAYGTAQKEACVCK